MPGHQQRDLPKHVIVSGFASEAERVAFLFGRYQTLTSMLPRTGGDKRRRK